MNYVDSDVILRKMQKIATEAWKMNITAKVEMIWSEAMDVIRFTPSEDVAPVVHAKWNVSIGDLYPNEPCGNCSNCGNITGFYKFFKYCPNCGAKMDGDRE